MELSKALYKAINHLVFFLFKDKRPDIAVKYGIEAYKHKPSEVMARYVANAFFRAGDIASALSWFSLHPNFNKKQISQYGSLKNLLDNGFTRYPENPINNIKLNTGREVVYLLHNSLPYFSGGYATRSNGVIGGIKINGWDISAISRLGFPNDTKKGPARNRIETIDGINYSLLVDDEFNVYKTPLSDYLIAYGEALYQKLKGNPPKVIHAASFFMNGIAAVYAARKLGCKAVYEIRGLNELSKMSDQPHWAGSEHYQMMVRMETQAALDADKVFTLTQALKDEFVNRGVEAEKITVLPNGVHSNRFSPMIPSKKLAKKLSLKGEVVIGFVGSFVDYEGLDLLMEAVSNIKGKTKTPFKVLMVGDGTCHTEIVDLSKRLKLANIVQFTGRVPHHDVEEYYSLIDICPFPRKGLPVCEMVSPLKPFEAMAMEKAVLSSNVSALAEIVSDNETGLLFEKDNIESLSEKLKLLIDDADLRKQLGVAARQWVVKERDWQAIGARVDHVYKELL
jgi:glycosyltransferase involved in cell wall biosynthesis